jgi:Sulfotransferase family
MSDSPGFEAEDLDLSNFTLAGMRAEAAPYVFSHEFKGVWRPLLGRFIRGRLLAEAVSQPAVRLSRAVVVVKEPNGSQAADMILDALPRSRVLFLLRDGRDVVDSELAAVGRGSWASQLFRGFRGLDAADRVDYVVQSAYKWLWRTEVVEAAFQAHRGPKLMMRYEDLRKNPKKCLQSVFDWLELPVDEATVSGLVQRHAFEQMPAAERGAGQFFRSASPGLWRENLTREEQAAMMSVIERKIRELGYPA